MIFGEEIARMYWSILDNKRIELLRKIVKTVSLNNYYMAGGTALSLQLNLRESFDFDFCVPDRQIFPFMFRYGNVAEKNGAFFRCLFHLFENVFGADRTFQKFCLHL